MSGSNVELNLELNPFDVVFELIMFAVEHEQKERQLELSKQQFELSKQQFELSRQQLAVSVEQLKLAYFRDERDAEKLRLYKERNWMEWKKFHQHQAQYVRTLFKHTDHEDMVLELRGLPVEDSYGYLLHWLIMSRQFPQDWNIARLANLAMLTPKEKEALVESYIAGNLPKALEDAEGYSLPRITGEQKVKFILAPELILSEKEWKRGFSSGRGLIATSDSEKRFVLLSQLMYYVIQGQISRVYGNYAVVADTEIDLQDAMRAVLFLKMGYILEKKYGTRDAFEKKNRWLGIDSPVRNLTDEDLVYARYALVEASKGMFTFNQPSITWTERDAYTVSGLNTTDKCRMVAHHYLMQTAPDYKAFCEVIFAHYEPSWVR